MKIKVKLSKIGTGYHIIIPKVVRDTKNLEEGDEVLIEILRKVEKNKEVKHYRCSVCENNFYTEDEIPICSVCDDSKNLKVISEDSG